MSHYMKRCGEFCNQEGGTTKKTSIFIGEFDDLEPNYRLPDILHKSLTSYLPAVSLKSSLNPLDSYYILYEMLVLLEFTALLSCSWMKCLQR